ncbi:MAG: SIR2 family protein [Solirubrobacteraceae bacterium]
MAVYMAPGTQSAGQFVHIPWDGEPQVVTEPNAYSGFPFDADRPTLTRTLIVRINGAVDDGLEQFPDDNYVITEDHYIDYFSGRSVRQVVPGKILAMLKKANYLFLGYGISDWRLRVFLHRVWEGPRLGKQNYWAIDSHPSALESRLWTQAGVTLYQAGLVDYLTALNGAIGGARAERGP